MGMKNSYFGGTRTSGLDVQVAPCEVKPKKVDSRREAMWKLHDTDDAQQVLMSCTIYNFFSLDLVNSRFGAEIGVHMYWLEPHLTDIDEINRSVPGGDKVKVLDAQDVSELRINVPELSFENMFKKDISIATVMDVRPGSFPTGGQNGTIVHWEERVRATFYEEFELQKFPYDTQELSMVMRLNSKKDLNLGRYIRPIAAVCPGGPKDNSVQLKHFTLPEWRIYHPHQQSRWSAKEGALWRVQGIVRRRHNFFTKNIMVQSGALASFGPMAFCQPTSDLSVRSRNLLALMLTMVAFKFLVANSLPKVPYFTILDIYMTVAAYFLLGILLCSSVMAFLHNDGILWAGYQPSDAQIWKVEVADRIFFYVAICFWIAWNVSYIRYIRNIISDTCRCVGDEVKAKVDTSWDPANVAKTEWPERKRPERKRPV